MEIGQFAVVLYNGLDVLKLCGKRNLCHCSGLTAVCRGEKEPTIALFFKEFDFVSSLLNTWGKQYLYSGLLAFLTKYKSENIQLVIRCGITKMTNSWTGFMYTINAH